MEQEAGKLTENEEAFRLLEEGGKTVESALRQLEEKKATVELQKKAKTPKVNLKKEYERVV